MDGSRFRFLFVCLERRGSESYPSRDKAVLFFEVSNLDETITAIGSERIVGGARDREAGRRWAVLHDPESHNVLLIERT